MTRILPEDERRHAWRWLGACGVALLLLAMARGVDWWLFPVSRGVETADGDVDVIEPVAQKATEAASDGDEQDAVAEASPQVVDVTDETVERFAEGEKEIATQIAAGRVSVKTEVPGWGLDEDPVPFVPACFLSRRDPRLGLQAKELRRWLVPIDARANIREARRYCRQPVVLPTRFDRSAAAYDLQHRTRYTWAAGFTGRMRLAAPWPPDAVLRLTPFDANGLTLEFWAGDTGVILRHYERGDCTWCTWRARRDGDGTLTNSLELAGTDSGRGRLHDAATLEIRHQDDQLIVTMGDLRVITAPLPATPEEVYFNGSAWLRDISMYRAGPVPEDVPRPRPVVVDGSKPAALDWHVHDVDGASWRVEPDESVELTATSTRALAWSAVRLPQRGLHEVVFQIDDPQPGTGVYLGDVDGMPRQAVGFFRGTRSGRALVDYAQPFDQRSLFPDGFFERVPIAWVGRQSWVRLVLGVRTLRAWTSPDGVNWSRLPGPSPVVTAGSPLSVGVYCVVGEATRRIRLRHLAVRELDGLTSLVQAETRQRAAAVFDKLSRGEADGSDVRPESIDMGGWLETVLTSQPRDVDGTSWRRACALATLVARPPWTLAAGLESLGNSLLLAMLEEALTADYSAQQLRDMLHDAALLADTRDSAAAFQFAALYRRLGEQLVRLGHDRPFTFVQRALLEAPLDTDARFATRIPALGEAELFGLVDAGRWHEVDQLVAALVYYTMPADPQSVAMEYDIVLRQLAGLSAVWSRNRDTGEGPHPAGVTIDKDAYNTLSEMHTLLADGAYDVVCEAIAAAAESPGEGLTLDPGDLRLMVSFPAALATMMRDHPGLRGTMNEAFGPRGLMRVRSAMRRGQVDRVAAATLEFYGTEAAAEAHRWLGDRHLLDGRFEAARRRYELACAAFRPFSDEMPDDLVARQRLAAAMQGELVGAAIHEPVTLGETTLEADAFERLVAEMAAQRTSPLDFPHGEVASGVTLEPGQYVMLPFAEFTGDAGTGASKTPYGSTLGIDWAGRQLATAVADEKLIVGNRFQVVALELGTGKTLWQHRLRGSQGNAHGWPLAAMRPVIDGGRVYARLLSRDGPELHCLDAETGAVVWRQSARSQDFASDPVVHQANCWSWSSAAPATRRRPSCRWRGWNRPPASNSASGIC